MATFPRPETWCWTVIGYLTCRSNGLMGGPWPMNVAIYSRPSAVSLKIWLGETNDNLDLVDFLQQLPLCPLLIIKYILSIKVYRYKLNFSLINLKETHTSFQIQVITDPNSELMQRIYSEPSCCKKHQIMSCSHVKAIPHWQDVKTRLFAFCQFTPEREVAPTNNAFFLICISHIDLT